MKTKLLFLCAILFSFHATHAQAPQEAVAQMIRTKLGDQCIIRNEEGKQISFNEAAQLTLGASALSKRVKYEPINVVDGISHEVRIKLVEPSAMKPLLDEIDFTNTQLGFYSQSKEKITGDEFKSTLQASPNLSAAAYQASNGVITDFFIISKPKPASVQMVSSGANASSNSVISSSSTSNSLATTATFSPLSVGNSMPDFKFTDIYGKKWNSRELKNKIVVFNFWFVECPPCLAEMPSLNKLMDKYKNDERVVFLAIANSGQQKIKEFLKEKQFNYPTIAREQSKSYLLDWEISSYPQNLVVNKGKIAFSFMGGTNNSDDFIFNMLSEEIEKCRKG